MEREQSNSKWSILYRHEDWWANWIGAIILIMCAFGLISRVPGINRWTDNFFSAIPQGNLLPLLGLGACIGLGYAVVLRVMKQNALAFLKAFPVVFILAVLAYAMGNQQTMRFYGFNYVIWALVLGMVVTNVFGRVQWILPGLKAELFIKTGLVLMGAEILLNRLLSLGIYGLGVAWLVTPVVIYVMYQFGTKVLRIKSASLVATISAAASVCGVSAAIATGAATRAKREEISFAISISLIFTIIMMLGLPPIINYFGLGESVGGAWIGGTVDSTGAVVAAGAMLGDTAVEIAAVVKMLQNAMIGVVSFIMATLWVTRVEREPGDKPPSLMEIWVRFPKFILGFVGASVFFSAVLIPLLGDASVRDILKVSGGAKDWLFCLAFVCIGLDTNFADMRRLAGDQRPLLLYIAGQSFNLVLTLLAAWVFFSGRFFPPVM